MQPSSCWRRLGLLFRFLKDCWQWQAAIGLRAEIERKGCPNAQWHFDRQTNGDRRLANVQALLSDWLVIIVTRAGSHVRRQWVESAECLTCWESKVRGLTLAKVRTQLRWCCWCADSAETADELIRLMLLILLMCLCCWCADSADALMLLMHWGSDKLMHLMCWCC